METSIIWIDHTLNEALKQTVDCSQLALIVRYLAQISICTGDIWLSDWKGYLAHNSSKQDTALLSYIKKEWRIKIPAGKGKTSEAIESGFSRLVLSLESSRDVIDVLEDELKELSGKEVYLELKSASSYVSEDWQQLWPLIRKYSIKGLLYRDEGCLDAAGAFTRLSEIQQGLPIPLEFHGENAYGLATATALSALRAGVSRIAVSIGGVGSHTALEEIWMASRYFLGYSAASQHFADCCRKILISLGVSIPGNKAILGSEIFSHESGLHVDGITKNARLYEAFSPEEVGLTRKLVIGKHSGSAALRYKLEQWKLGLNKEEALSLLTEVRKMASVEKRAVTDYQLKELYFKLKGV